MNSVCVIILLRVQYQSLEPALLRHAGDEPDVVADVVPPSIVEPVHVDLFEQRCRTDVVVTKLVGLEGLDVLNRRCDLLGREPCVPKGAP